MSGLNSVNVVFAIIFVMFGIFMLMLGGAVLVSGPSNEIEWTIVLMSFIATSLLFYGAKQTYQNSKRKLAAEQAEAQRLKQKFSVPNAVAVERVSEKPNQPELKDEKAAHAEDAMHPEILARWLYSAADWKIIMNKLAEKTKKEELYTAFWFPVLTAIIFWSEAIWGFAIGLVLGFLYVRFRMYFVKKKFQLSSRTAEAEIIVSDSYLRVNGNFIHYADGHYYLRNLSRDRDPKLGDFLLFNIGWTTSKGYPAQMDLYLPIPLGREMEAELILEKFQAAR